MDYIMHFLTVFWKIIFAFIPPTGELLVIAVQLHKIKYSEMQIQFNPSNGEFSQSLIFMALIQVQRALV
jgi:hypothetical protein